MWQALVQFKLSHIGQTIPHFTAIRKRNTVLPIKRWGSSFPDFCLADFNVVFFKGYSNLWHIFKLRIASKQNVCTRTMQNIVRNYTHLYRKIEWLQLNNNKWCQNDLQNLTWCLKSTIATAWSTVSQINYWKVFSEFRSMLPEWSSCSINSSASHQHWSHYTNSLSITWWISKSHCWFTKPYVVKLQFISQISCSPMIHPGSYARLTCSSSHSRPVV